jgi:hypothetical protein
MKNYNSAGLSSESCAFLDKAKSLEDAYKLDSVKACQKALRITRGIDERERLEVIDRLLATCGTEAIGGEWQNGFWCDIVAAYCNTGDTYAVTVMAIRGECRYDSSRFIVSSFGDWIERHGEKMGVQ